jgi:hypothetical protein
MTQDVNSGPLNYLKFLPPVLKNWGERIHKISKADKGMICYSLLGALSSTGCRLVNEKRYINNLGNFITGPTGLSLIVIAGSGSLKSTIKNMTFRPIEQAIAAKMPQYKQDLARYRHRSRDKKSFSDIDFFEAEEPITPNFLQNNVTIESIINLYGKGMLYMSILSDEGGTFVGSRAMSKDSYINTLSAFNTLISGDAFSKSTIKGGETLLIARRLTFMMYMQPQIFEEFIKRCGNISDAGFLQRTLVTTALPADSEVAESFIADVIDSFYENITPLMIYDNDEYRAYKILIESIMAIRSEIDDNCLLTPRVIEPSNEAKTIWFMFYVEQKKIIKEELALFDDDMNSFRERAPETASRIAALFQLANNYGRTDTPVSADNMRNAIEIVKLSLAAQFKTYGVRDAFFENVDKLTQWYNKRDAHALPTRMPLRKLIQLAPNSLRKRDILMPILEYLIKERVIEYDEIDYIYLGEKS